MADIDLPQGALKLHELKLLVFLDEDGNECIVWDWVDEAPAIAHAIGLLEITKLMMLDATDSEE